MTGPKVPFSHWKYGMNGPLLPFPAGFMVCLVLKYHFPTGNMV